MNELGAKLATLDLKGLIVAGLIAGGLYFYLYFDNGSGLVARNNDLDAQITQEKQKEVETEKNAKKVQTEKENLKNMEDRFTVLQGEVPKDLQMTDVVKWVDSKTVGSSVSLNGKEPKPITKIDFLEELPMRITLEGRYSDITLYLYNLMSAKEMLGKISSITLKAGSSSTTGNPGIKLSAEINLSGFRIAEPTLPGDPKKPEVKN